MPTDEGDIYDFRVELKDVKGCAENTCNTYCSQVTALSNFLITRKRTLRTADREDFIAWRQSMNDRAGSGIAIAVVAARSFYQILKRKECDFPDFKVKIKRQEPIDVPSVKQFLVVRELLQKPTTDKRAIDQATREAIVETLAGSGLRIEAFLSLRVHHIHTDNARPYILVDAADMGCKGNRAQTIPLAPYAAAVLAKYIASRGIEGPELVFKVSGSMVRKLLIQVEPDGVHLKPHSLRHFYCSATYFRNFDGGRTDPVWVRDAAGHSSIATTDNYLRMAKRVVQTDAEWEKWALVKAVS